MLSLELALRLQDAGITWDDPAPGDRFVVPVEQLQDMVFVLSDMTTEVHEFPTGPLIGFNGTTEWALDSVRKSEVVWLPRESQLRAMLGEAFVRLEPVGDGLVVVVRVDGEEARLVDIDAERAYARAVLAVHGQPA
ncbi:MAG TPA: pilus assembly protein CpaE [Segeticoccus sp.]|uniref:pilus assembly protein CpaE n=1 Tax=Segeticoccus sp. TaxID=2706531 RepID=UPI002D81025E|nr:pilus assembly protein CpaE [Segeticoccus sp.]HET8598900.1 pilus assembly protein CpaE [Segeticoccus sp.]